MSAPADVVDDLGPGDRLWIRPSIGRPYSARVTDTTDERVRVRLEETSPTGETHTRTRWLHADEIADAAVAGDLRRNPDRPARR